MADIEYEDARRMVGKVVNSHRDRMKYARGGLIENADGEAVPIVSDLGHLIPASSLARLGVVPRGVPKTPGGSDGHSPRD